LKTFLINFANEKFEKRRKVNSQSGLNSGFDHCVEYTSNMFPLFYRKYKHILDQPRGCGYWLWKPYIILQTLLQVNDGDVVMYSDSGATFINSIQPLVDTCLREEIVLFELNGIPLKSYTKRDCFYYMWGNTIEYHNTNFITASFQLYKRCERSITFVEKYLKWCCNEDVLTDKPNTCGLPNLPEFKDHRHDQSVLTILAKHNDIKLHADPSEYGNNHRHLYDNSNYGQIIWHHR